MQQPQPPSNLFSAYTTATPPALAFSPPPGMIASPGPSHVATPRASSSMARYQSPSAHPLPLPADLAGSTATTTRKRGPATGAGPSSLGGGVRSATGVASALEDPTLEARRVLGVLLGVGVGEVGDAAGGGGGLVGEIERALELVLKRWESPFDESIDAPDIKTVLTSLTTLLHLLRNSPLGGLSIAPSPTGLPEISGAAVQKLFKERQRGREGAAIAGETLGAT